MSVSTSSSARSSPNHYQRTVGDGATKGVNEDFSALFQSGANRNDYLLKMEHDRSLQELDEAVASADRFSSYYSAQAEEVPTNVTSALPSSIIAAAGVGGRGGSVGTGGNPICPLELRRVKSGQSTKSSHSTRSGRSKRSVRNSSRKRGNSLEREISQTILKTATEEEPHFVTSTTDIPESSNRTAQFILTDLFNDSSSKSHSGSWQSTPQEDAMVLESQHTTSPIYAPENHGNEKDNQLSLGEQYDHSQDFIYTVSTQSTGDNEENAASLVEMQSALPPTSQMRSSTDYYPPQSSTVTPASIENEDFPDHHQYPSDNATGSAMTSAAVENDDIFDNLDPMRCNPYEEFVLAQSPGDMRIGVIKEEDEETDTNTAGESTVGNNIDTKTTDGTGTLVFSLEDEYCLPIDDSLLQYSTTNGTSERSDLSTGNVSTGNVSVGELLTSSAEEREINGIVKKDANESITTGGSTSSTHKAQEGNCYQYYNTNEAGSPGHDTSLPSYGHEHVDEKKEDAAEDIHKNTQEVHKDRLEGRDETKPIKDVPAAPGDAKVFAKGFEAFSEPPESWTTFDGTPFSHDTAFATDADDAFLPFDDNVFEAKSNNDSSSSNVGSWKRRSIRSKLVVEATTAYESPKPVFGDPMKSPSPQSPSSIFYFNSSVPADKNAANVNNSNSSSNTTASGNSISNSSGNSNSNNRRKHKLVPAKKEQWRIRSEEVSTKASF